LEDEALPPGFNLERIRHLWKDICGKSSQVGDEKENFSLTWMRRYHLLMKELVQPDIIQVSLSTTSRTEHTYSWDQSLKEMIAEVDDTTVSRNIEFFDSTPVHYMPL